MSVKYHINPETGKAGVCRAKINCRFGDVEHYSTKDEAQSAYEAKMSESMIPQPVNTVDVEEFYDELNTRIEIMDFEEIEDYANQSKNNHETLNSLIEQRGRVALEFKKTIDMLDPANKDSEYVCDKDTIKALRKDFNIYKDKTATLVEAHLASKFYEPKYLELEDDSRVGNAVRITSHDPNTREWLEARFNSVGGSDVGALVVMDFEDDDKIMYWDRKTLEKVEQSKLEMPSDEEIESNQWFSMNSKGGALYRGTVWEDRSRDMFVEENKNMDVYNTKNQYCNPNRPWQQVNFDGVTADKNSEPSGILELKTGNDANKWKDGPPLNYRAQVLYYLNATGLEKATIAATINDGEMISFTLHKDDPVAPTSRWKGGYDGSMEDYIKNRIEPWFNNLKESRKKA